MWLGWVRGKLRLHLPINVTAMVKKKKKVQ